VSDWKRIAIVGGGPAGSIAAAALAGAGHPVVIFDEKLAWEKPCGGGITHKALLHWPFLRDPSIECKWIQKCELTSPSGRRVLFRMEHPVAIFSRKVLNGFLLDRARSAGAQVVAQRVVGIQRGGQWQLRTSSATFAADFMIIADGARSSLRKHVSSAFSSEDLMITAGYYLPGHSDTMEVEFLPGLHGYIWIFPRVGHFSAGICGPLQDKNTAQLLRLLEFSLHSRAIDFSGRQFYAHVLPAPRASTLRNLTVAGEGWAMVGDAAGLVDPITGEGLYYAMRSGELAAEALLQGAPDAYRSLLQDDLLPELEIAAGIAGRFYTGRWLGDSMIQRVVQFTGTSSSFRSLMGDMFAGTQGYRDLRNRLYRSLPVMLAKTLASALRLRGNETVEPEDSSSLSGTIVGQIH